MYVPCLRAWHTTLTTVPACLPAPAAFCVQRLCSTIAEQLETAAGQLLQLCQAGLPEPVSYNAVITRDFMLMVPRSREMSGPIGIKWVSTFHMADRSVCCCYLYILALNYVIASGVATPCPVISVLVVAVSSC